MTLVAAFRSFGTPALVGDLLITSIDNRESQRKKVRILLDRLAIAWTGHLMAAQKVIETLQIRINLHPSLNRTSLESILTAPNFVELGKLQVTLIGWVIEETTEHCFRWNSDYPGEVFYGDPMFDGSGENEALRQFGDAGLRLSDPGFVADRMQAVHGVLGAVTNLMKAEVIGPSFRRHGFGFAFEAIILNQERRFEYINNVYYYSLIHKINEEGTYVTSTFIGKHIKVTDRGGNSLIWVFDPDRDEQICHHIAPVGLPISYDKDEVVAEFFSNTGPSPFSASHYCAFLIFEAPNFSSPPCAEAFDETANLVDLSDRNKLQLKFDPARIEWMYRVMVEDMKRKQQG